MHHLVATASTASLALLAASHTSEPITLTFSPETGTVIERSINVQTSVVSGDLMVVMGGQEVPQMYLPDITVEIDTAHLVEITDAFIAPTGKFAGHPRVREITDASQEVRFAMDAGGFQGMEDMESVMDASSPLKGASFRIGTDADGGVAVEWTDQDESLDDALLDGLQPGLDLAGLLPKGAVKVGAEWKADASVLAELLQPSGDLAWEWSGDGADSIPDSPDVEYSGELGLRLVEVTGGDAGALARIKITGTLTEVETSETNLDHVPVADGTATEVRTTRYDIEGELSWSVDRDVLHAVEFELNGEGDQVTTRDPNQPGQTYESTMVHTSELRIRVECRPAR